MASHEHSTFWFLHEQYSLVLASDMNFVHFDLSTFLVKHLEGSRT